MQKIQETFNCVFLNIQDNKVMKTKNKTKKSKQLTPLDWKEINKESKRCLKICMEMDELDNNDKK